MLKFAKVSNRFLLNASLYLFLSSAVVAAYQQQQQQQQDQQQEPRAEPYSFSYSAQSIGGSSSHQESGDGSGRVTGFYTIQGEDGRERRVDYVADENGYRASIKTNEIGTRSGNSADAEYQVQMPSAGQLEAAKVSYEQYQQLEEAHASEQARIQSRQSLRSSSASSSSNQQTASLQTDSLRQQQPNLRQSREPDARDLPATIVENQLDSQRQQQPQRANWQTRATDQAQVRGARFNYPQQQQQQQQANQLINQDYSRQQLPALFENTSQFLIDEPQQPQWQQPQLQQQRQQLQPQQQLRPQQQLQWQQPTGLSQNRPVAGADNQVEQVNNNNNYEAPIFNPNENQPLQQQQQYNIINEPADMDVVGPISMEIPRQPDLELQRNISMNATNFGQVRPTTPSGFLSINLANDYQNERPTIPQTTTVGQIRDQEQVSLVSGNVSAKQPIDTTNYQQQQVTQAVQTGGQADFGYGYEKQVVSMEQQQQQEIPNSVNQIIENFSRQPIITSSMNDVPVVTTRRPSIAQSNNFAKQQEFSLPVQRQPLRFVSGSTTTTTLAPSTPSSISIIRQTTTSAPITTTETADDADEQAATTPALEAQSVFTTPARIVGLYQPETTTTTTPAPTTTSARPQPQPSTSTAPRRPQQQQQYAGVKGGQLQGTGIFRKKGLNGTQANQQYGQLVASSISGRPAGRVIATTRAPQFRLPIQQGDQQRQQLIVNNQQRKPLQQQQQQQQRFQSEAPYSIYATERPQVSSVSYAASGRNRTSSSSSSSAASLAKNQQQQRFNQQQPNNNSIRLNSTISTTGVSRPNSEQAQIGRPDNQIINQQQSRLEQSGQQQQQWKGIKGGGRSRSGGKQFWQASSNNNNNSIRNSGNGRFQVAFASNPGTTMKADDFATSLGYGSRALAPATDLDTQDSQPAS